MSEFIEKQQADNSVTESYPQDWGVYDSDPNKIDWSDAQIAHEPTESLYDDLECDMKRAVVGQDGAVEEIVRALSREKMRSPNRPIANLLFLGPTGVGKTEAAKALSYYLHEAELKRPPFLKIDCSEYSSGHTVAALVGSPPGYVGRKQKPLIDKELVEQKKSVVLFDEIEKGSSELWDLMLQIMDEGELTLAGTGERVSFRDSIVIMTSNIGAGDMMRVLSVNGGVGFRAQEVAPSQRDIEKAATEALKREFRPEFIARIDQKIVFNSLDDEGLARVLDGYVDKANDTYYESAGVTLFLSDELRSTLVSSVDERRQYGARPILRQYDQCVEAKLSKYVDAGSIPEGSLVLAEVGESGDPRDVILRHKPDRDYHIISGSLEKEVVVFSPTDKERLLGIIALQSETNTRICDAIDRSGVRSTLQRKVASVGESDDMYVI